MKDRHRKESARLRAEAYAPAPTDSRLLYGVIAVALLLMVIAAAGAFYAVDLWRQPLLIAALAAFAFAIGLIVRRFQMRQHRIAHRVEYNRVGGDASEEHAGFGDHAGRDAR